MRTLHSFICGVLLLTSFSAYAQDAYPSKPIKIVVPFPPGGTSDILARTIGQKLFQEWGQPVIIENRPGAGANIGADAVAKSSPDGYTLLILSTIHMINPSLYKNLTFDPIKDFAPIGMIAETSQVVLVHPSLPIKSIQELIDYAKEHPKALNYSSAGNGSQPHLSAELFKSMTGANMVHIPYKGAPPAITDLIAGQVSLTFATAPSAVPVVRSGQARAIAVTTLKRIAALPDVPTVAESGVVGYESAGWNGLVGPAGMPSGVIEKLSAALTRILRTPEIRKQMIDQGADPVIMTPMQFAHYLGIERSKWASVVKISGAQID
ncbi:MAG: tripartite tricarboxylate transporter substrate binding protein [Betaproteobacteria bacterium]|jgi:tripartite-type tricarboxylate transporter receptor subunit TctC